MTISPAQVTAAPHAAQTTDAWLAEYRQLLRSPAPGMLEMFQLLAQAAEIFHDTGRVWQLLYPLAPRIASPYAGGWTYGQPSDYWADGGVVHGPLSPDDPGQGGLAVPRQPGGDCDDTDG